MPSYYHLIRSTYNIYEKDSNNTLWNYKEKAIIASSTKHLNTLVYIQVTIKNLYIVENKHENSELLNII